MAVNMLEKYKGPEEISKMSLLDLKVFSNEIREFLIDKVSKSGGHLASNLGVVELTLSLYNIFDFTKDKIIWDVGHQSYVHKILTGRKEGFDTLRKYKGMSGFPKKEESKFDMFQTGHSSTSISVAVGMARARDLSNKDNHVIAVIGDGALTGGMAFEAMNDVGFRKTKLIIILNDNQMSIANNVGGIATYLSKLRMAPTYNKFKNEFNSTLEKSNIGKGVVNSINKIKDSIKQIIVPGMLFEDMGLTYLGPIDGHNIKEMSKVLELAKSIDGPVIIHALTQKGKGYDFAEKNPKKFHGIGPFNCESGEICNISGETYSSAFGKELMDIAEKNKKVVAITAAMPDGTGLKEFAKKYKNRFFDVGIAEEHAVTMAAGMASEGLKPVFAVYSTFLQRAYDQILHDVCLQKLPVIFAIDRAGIVGEDGETHQGIFDLSYLTHIPNINILAPKCTQELRYMLRWAVEQDFPIAIRYPRGGDKKDFGLKPRENFKLGTWEVVSEGDEVAIVATGKLVSHAFKAKEILIEKGFNPVLISASFIKPIDMSIIDRLINEGYDIVTIEDNVLHGGLGSLVLEYINTKGKQNKVINLGFQDEFVEHGNADLLYSLHGLDAEGIAQSISQLY